jgi:hypothetical protein
LEYDNAHLYSKSYKTECQGAEVCVNGISLVFPKVKRTESPMAKFHERFHAPLLSVALLDPKLYTPSPNTCLSKHLTLKGFCFIVAAFAGSQIPSVGVRLFKADTRFQLLKMTPKHR